jgi:type IV pilus assembly protein PilA
MTRRLLVRTKSESGFTLVELLVVMLIIGLLAAIAIPAFFNQRNKANDAGAKEAVRTAQTAMETFSTDNNGTYVKTPAVTPADLQLIEGAVPPACGSVTPCLTITGTGAATAPTNTAYKVTVTAKTTGNKYSIDRNGGTLTYPCSLGAGQTDRGGCPASGFWN